MGARVRKAALVAVLVIGSAVAGGAAAATPSPSPDDYFAVQYRSCASDTRPAPAPAGFEMTLTATPSSRPTSPYRCAILAVR